MLGDRRRWWGPDPEQGWPPASPWGEVWGGEGQRYPPVGPRERGLLEKAAAQLPRGRRQSWGVRKAKGHDGDRADPTGSAE